MGFLILAAAFVCLLAWFHRGLSLATKLFFTGTYAVSWAFILMVDPYAGVGLQMWLIALVLGLFPAQMVWLDVVRWWTGGRSAE